jgi:hypothetical protein
VSRDQFVQRLPVAGLSSGDDFTVRVFHPIVREWTVHFRDLC